MCMKREQTDTYSRSESDKVYNDRSLAMDYYYLFILNPGMKVLDVGCGTGFISKDIAAIVGETERLQE